VHVQVVAYVLNNLELYMKKRNMKLIQLFEEMDADGSGSLSVEVTFPAYRVVVVSNICE